MNDLGFTLVACGSSSLLFSAVGWAANNWARWVRNERAAWVAVDEEFAAVRERSAGINEMARHMRPSSPSEAPTLKQTVRAWREALRPTPEVVEDLAPPAVDKRQWPDSVVGLAVPVRRDRWEELDVQREVLADPRLRARLKEPTSARDTGLLPAVDAGQVSA